MKLKSNVIIFLQVLLAFTFIACPLHYAPEFSDISDSVEIKFADDIKIGKKTPFEIVFGFDTSDFSFSKVELHVIAPKFNSRLPSFKVEDSDGEISCIGNTLYLELSEEKIRSGSLKLFLTFYQEGSYSLNTTLTAWSAPTIHTPGGKQGFFTKKLAIDASYPFEIEQIDISDKVKIEFNTESIKQNENIPLNVSLDFTGTDFVHAELELYSYSEWNAERIPDAETTSHNVFLVLNDANSKKFDFPMQVSFPDSAPNMVKLNLLVMTEDAGLIQGGKKGIISKEFNFFVNKD